MDKLEARCPKCGATDELIAFSWKEVSKAWNGMMGEDGAYEEVAEHMDCTCYNCEYHWTTDPLSFDSVEE